MAAWCGFVPIAPIIELSHGGINGWRVLKLAESFATRRSKSPASGKRHLLIGWFMTTIKERTCRAICTTFQRTASSRAWTAVARRYYRAGGVRDRPIKAGAIRQGNPGGLVTAQPIGCEVYSIVATRRKTSRPHLRTEPSENQRPFISLRGAVGIG